MDFDVKLQIGFIELISKYVLIFLNETWISDKNKTNLDINGYTSDTFRVISLNIQENVCCIIICSHCICILFEMAINMVLVFNA